MKMSESNTIGTNDGKRKKPAVPRRRQTHNAVERRRKDKINGWISKIAELLPCKEVHKQSKISTLEQTVDYIKRLVSEKEKLMSDRCSEVQAEEVKQLKKKLTFVTEQNAVYEKLLLEANISLNSLSEKVLKYSNKLENKNGSFVVKNSDSNKNIQCDKSIQVNIISSPTFSEVASSGKNIASQMCKKGKVLKHKSTLKSVLKPKITSASTSSSSTLANVPINTVNNQVCLPTSSSALIVSHNGHTENQIVQDIILPNVVPGDSVKNASIHTGGVTTALSQFPVMSTTQGSSLVNVCNKNMSTIIIPAGGNILQQYQPQDKSSNTISIICPSTLPILWPQLINVAPVTRNVGLPSLICPTQIDNSCLQGEKSSLNNTLITINPSTVVPISSNISANTRIVLPAQPTILGNACATSNFSQSIIPTFTNPLTPSDPLIVPLQQASSSDSANKRFHAHCLNSDENKAENSTQPSVSNCVTVSSNLCSKAVINSTIPLNTSQTIVEKVSNSEGLIIERAKNKAVRNMPGNSLPSLQVLSANKIISLANQSQKIQASLSVSLNQKLSPSCPPVSSNSHNNAIQQLSNTVCLQINAAESDPLETNKSSDISAQNVPITTCCTSISLPDSSSKSNFSLSALMGNSISNKDICSTSKELEQNKPTDNSISSQSAISSAWPVIKSGNQSSMNRTTSQCEETLPGIGNQKGIKKHIISSDHVSSSIVTSSSVSKSFASFGSSQNNSGSLVSSSSSDLQASPNKNLILSSNSSIISPCKSISSVDKIMMKSPQVQSSTNTKINISPIKEIQISQMNTNTKGSSNNENSSVTIQVPNNVFSDTVSFVVNDCAINQNILPSMFSMNQIVSLNSTVFTNSSLPGSIPSSQVVTPSRHLSSNVTSALPSSSSNVCPSLPNLYPIGKQPITSTLPLLSACLDRSVVLSENDSAHLANNELASSKSESISAPNKNFLSNSKNEKSKQVSNFKKKKTPPKVNRPDMSSNICNQNDISQIGSNLDSDKIQINEKSNSQSKEEDHVNVRSETSSYFSHCDILARATESIFGTEVLEANYLSKRGIVYLTSDPADTNSSTSVCSKENSIIQCSSSNSDPIISNSKALEENSEVRVDNSGNTLNSISDNSEHQTVCDESVKQNKQGKIRKNKLSLDDEPPQKRTKENSTNSGKAPEVDSFSECHQLLDSALKPTSTESNVADITHSVIDSIGNFNNQIQIPENNCKTPTTVDTVFSINPMLGDILKDVSPSIVMESRNTFLTCNENQSMFNNDKNYQSVNFSNPAEEYLNLPRMNFTSSSENSTQPTVQSTNVSFSHTTSLCATMSDNSKNFTTVSLSESQVKPDSKKKNLFCGSDQNQNLSALSGTKTSDCGIKLNHSESHFSVSSKTSTSHIHSQTTINQVPSVNSTVTSDPIGSEAESPFTLRADGYGPVPNNSTFYTPMSNVSSVQNFPSSSSMLYNSTFNCINTNGIGSLPFTKQNTNLCNSNTFSSQTRVDALNHSLSSLLKENSNTNILSENRNGAHCQTSQSSSSVTSNISQSKYSALSLISDQPSYSESIASSTNHSDYIQSSIVCTPISSTQFTSTSTTCSRIQRASLSYSAESLLQTSCASSDKSKQKNDIINRYPQRFTDKKNERTNVTNMHNISDTPIFLPVSSCDISIQNAPLVPLPPVTSFHNFSSNYNPCETVSTSIFNGMTRTHDVPLTLSNDNFLNMNLSAESQIVGNRHETSTISKHHSNISLPFENHSSLYNNCNFLPHVKPTLENSRASESGPCFQPNSFGNNYPQPSQKTNCCNFSHRSVSSNPDMSSELSMPVGPPVPTFHSEKNNFNSHRPTIQPPFSQNNANFVGNIFYNSASNNTREVNDMTAKPSNTRPSQEVFVPESRQNVHNSSIFSNRKAVVSNRSKTKKNKTANINDSSINITSNIATFGSIQENGCNKPNSSCVPNGYFKTNPGPPIVPPNQIQCSQQKMSESSANSVIPSNPTFNPVLHQQSDNFFNLNFQHPNFAMSQLPRPPTQPLSCSCLTTPIISHTYSPSTHPVPNFNLSNILPDMGCSNNQVSISPVKFPSMNHNVQSSSSPCQTNSTITNSAHIISHQACAPTLYPSHAPMVRSTLNPILGHNPQSFGESQVPLVGGGPAPVMSQNTFSATQNPPFRNVIHSLPFARSDR